MEVIPPGEGGSAGEGVTPGKTDAPQLEVGSELVVVLTTEATLERAETLASTLLDRGLVACVSLLPIVSRYRWEGRLTRSEEVQLLLKTHRSCLEALHGALLALHSYDTPEWITLTARTCGDYGQWIAAQLAGPPVKADAPPPAPPRIPGDGDPTG